MTNRDYPYVLDTEIKKIREEKRMTITCLGKVTLISRPYLSQVENGARKPSLDTLYKLSKGLDVPLRRLIEFSGYSLDE